MRRLLVTLASLVLALPVVAQDSKSKPIPWANKFFSGKSEAPPPVVLHDFGTLPKGTVKTYRFEMKNIYAFPVNVKEPNVKQCNCVSVLEYTAKMGPLETGKIDIKIDTSRFDGPKSVEIDVRFDMRDSKTNEAFFSYASMEIRAVSRQDIAINPGAIQFGTVPSGQKATEVAKFYYTGKQREWKITEFSGFNKNVLDVTVNPVAIRGGILYEVSATLKPNAPAGAVDEQVVLKTNDKESPVLTLNVFGHVQAPLSIVGTEPGNLLKMGGVEIGKKLQKQVIVRADKAFTVTKVSGEGEGLSAQMFPGEARNSQVVTVVFTPDKPGPVKKEFTVKTSTGESIVMTVEGIGTEPKQ
jgi:hypothetical protein